CLLDACVTDQHPPVAPCASRQRLPSSARASRSPVRAERAPDRPGAAEAHTPTHERAREAVGKHSCGAAARATTPPGSRAAPGGGAGRAQAPPTRFQQEAELKDLRAAFPADEAIQSPVLQDVRARLDRTAQAFFRRLAAGEKADVPR